MCGIAGFVDPHDRVKRPDAVLKQMLAQLRHRGPDDQGMLSTGGVHIGHTRLSILDLSPQGRQPFDVHTPEGRFISAANGEIYNHLALRGAIKEREPRASVPPNDCAVLPWLAAESLDTVAQRVTGMFAFAVWDAARERLLLARDPAGQKPLYFSETEGGGLVFASELKALLRHPHVARQLDPIAVRQFLCFDFVPTARSIYAGVQKLEPGQQLIWHAGRTTLRSFEPPPSNTPLLRAGQQGENALWEALVEAVGTRLMSDVPLGVFLSGGLDSAAIVAALGEHRDLSSIGTFSIGFEDKAFDESDRARTVSQHFGTRHFEKELSADMLVSLVPRIAQLTDEPFADPSIIPTYLLSEFAREHITVALGGDGGDEHLWGYPTFFAERWAERASLLPPAMRRLISGVVERAVPDGFGHMSVGFKLRRFLSGLGSDPLLRHVTWIGGVPAKYHRDALQPAFTQGLSSDPIGEELERLSALLEAARPGASTLERLAWQYERTYLADGVLAKVDRASMAHGLEVRAPFLDRRVRSVCAQLAPEAKLKGRTTKVALRNVLEGRLPSDIVGAPKKGFGIPLARWLRGPLKEWMCSVLEPSAVSQGGVFNPDWTQRLIHEHVSGRVNHRKALWSVISFELWRTGPFGPEGG